MPFAQISKIQLVDAVVFKVRRHLAAVLLDCAQFRALPPPKEKTDRRRIPTAVRECMRLNKALA